MRGVDGEGVGGQVASDTHVLKTGVIDALSLPLPTPKLE